MASMKLQRYGSYDQAMTGSTAGHWVSADGKWFFVKLRGGWTIDSEHFSSPSASAEQKAADERSKLLMQSGLYDARFKTRREALEALSLLLASVEA